MSTTTLHDGTTELAVPETPQHNGDTRLEASQGRLESEEDPRIGGDSPVSISNLPLEAQVRSADEDGLRGRGASLTATELAAAESAAGRG